MSFIILFSNSVNSIHIYWFPISSPTDFRFWLSLYRTLKIDYILSRFNCKFFKWFCKSWSFNILDNSKFGLSLSLSCFIHCLTSISPSISNICILYC
uniref:Candidate secreted effector n=1 Tax=Meloidogyne incognita TaxID=6306 RepID=A0A914KLS6_MELIC